MEKLQLLLNLTLPFTIIIILYLLKELLILETALNTSLAKINSLEEIKIYSDKYSTWLESNQIAMINNNLNEGLNEVSSSFNLIHWVGGIILLVSFITGIIYFKNTSSIPKDSVNTSIADCDLSVSDIFTAELAANALPSDNSSELSKTIDLSELNLFPGNNPSKIAVDTDNILDSNSVKSTICNYINENNYSLENYSIEYIDLMYNELFVLILSFIFILLFIKKI
tara:strand:- start:28 stop:705 length:678 start_codon:yes stop_codon:yes gene_type:complete